MSELKRFALFIAVVVITVLLISVCFGGPTFAHTTPYVADVGDNRSYACLDGLIIVTVGTSSFYYHTESSGSSPVRCDNFRLFHQ